MNEKMCSIRIFQVTSYDRSYYFQQTIRRLKSVF